MGQEDVVLEYRGLGNQAAVGVQRLLRFGGEPVGVCDAEQCVGDAELIIQCFANGERLGEQRVGGIGIAKRGPTGGNVVQHHPFVEPIRLFTVNFQRFLVFGDGGFVAGLGGKGSGALGNDGRVLLGRKGKAKHEE